MYHFYSKEERDERRRKQALGLILDNDDDGDDEQQHQQDALSSSATTHSFLTPPDRLHQVDQSVNLMDVETGHYEVDLDGSTRRYSSSRSAGKRRIAELPRSSSIGSSWWWNQLSQAAHQATSILPSRQEQKQLRNHSLSSSPASSSSSSSSWSSSGEEEEEVFEDEELGLRESKRTKKKRSKKGKTKRKKGRKNRKKNKERKATGYPEDCDPNLWDDKARQASNTGNEEPPLLDNKNSKQTKKKNKKTSKKNKDKKKRLRWGRVAIVAAVFFALMVIVFMVLILTGQLAWKKLRRRHETNVQPQSQPQKTTMARNYSILDVSSLPESTQLLLHDHLDHTPQDQAFQWLRQDYPRVIIVDPTDHNHHSNLRNATIPTTTTTTTTITSPLDSLHAMQRFVLATLYHATGGEQWKDAQYWLSHNHSECDWFHRPLEHSSDRNYEICNRHGQLHHLKLRWQGLDGTLVRELGLLSAIKRFDVGHNQLKGVLPESLWMQWKNLELLDVQHNQLSGQLPSTLASLTSSNGLHSIILNYNRFSGTLPTEVGLLVPKLRILEVEHNRLSGTIPTELGGSSGLVRHNQLQSLMLNGNGFEGYIPSELGQLTQLTLLNLHHNAQLEPQRLPQEICDLWQRGTLQTLTVDCGIVDCGGCQCECVEPLGAERAGAVQAGRTTSSSSKPTHGNKVDRSLRGVAARQGF